MRFFSAWFTILLRLLLWAVLGYNCFSSFRSIALEAERIIAFFGFISAVSFSASNGTVDYYFYFLTIFGGK